MSAGLSTAPLKKGRYLFTKAVSTFLLILGYQYQIYFFIVHCLQMTYFPLPQINKRFHKSTAISYLTVHFLFYLTNIFCLQCLICSQQIETAPVLQTQSIINFFLQWISFAVSSRVHIQIGKAVYSNPQWIKYFKYIIVTTDLSKCIVHFYHHPL